MRKNVPIFTYDLAKYLLSLGFNLVDLEPNYHTNNRYELVFFFKDENGLKEEINKYINRNYKNQ